MASVTFTVDPETLEAAQQVAEQRQTSLDQMFFDYVASVARVGERDEASIKAEREENRRQLLELMYSSPLGVIDRPLTREEIYKERERWPRS